MTLPTTWETYKLGELADYVNGRAFKSDEWESAGIPIVRIQNLNDPAKPFNYFSGAYAEKHKIDSGDVLLSWSGTPGTSFGCFIWTRGEALVNQHIFKVKIKDDLVLREYFVYATNSRLEEMINLAHGAAGLRHITKAKLEMIELPVPPLDEQRRIVARIKECMERVEEIESLRHVSLVEREYLAESLVEAQLAGLDGEDVCMADVCEITSRLIDPREAQFRTRLHVGGANIESKTGRLIDLKTAAEENLKSSKFVFDESMVLYNKIRPYLMKVARPDFSGVCSADMYPLTPKAGKATRDFIYYELMSRRFTDYAISGSNRAGMPKVNREHLFAYRFKLPSLAVQQQICEHLDEAVEAVHSLGHEMATANLESTQLREAILRKAFAGEL
ncbi:restriction endonuclease subunit S [Pseudomonas putida]|uniref:restriction endonuclease subunit S n=1 Tax=Pseudomonas putida TaxID=303 RepID=UPI00068AE3AD|nr:restriction endonuclease subunit S [Pseudomonas putida]